MGYNDLKIDLHIHSDASDGTLSPTDILAKAVELNLGAIAITDHDTIEGSKRAIQSGIPDSLGFLTGIEISASPPHAYPCKGSFHILGYGVNLDDPVLTNTLKILQEARSGRNPRIVERLRTLGFDISFDELTETFGERQLGRPHIAQLMIKKGIVGSIDEAFDFYLSPGKPGYVDKYRIECQNAIDVIIGAGGVPVLAHPALVEPTTDEPFEKLIKILKSMGIRGVEVYYPMHTQSHVAELTEFAMRYDLLMTGGTDFHGSVKPEIEMGKGEGDLRVPYELFEKLTQLCPDQVAYRHHGN